MQFSGLYNLNGIYVWCEVQLNLTRMIALKSGTAEGQGGGGGGKASGKAGHNGFNIARAINGFAPETYMYAGEWGEDVADQAHAGLLLEIDLEGTSFKDDAARASFTKALQSPKCRVRKLEMGGMKLGEAGGAAKCHLGVGRDGVWHLQSGHWSGFQ